MAWFIKCFIAIAASAIILGFNFPVALVLVSLLGLDAFYKYIESTKKEDPSKDIEARLSGIESKIAASGLAIRR